MIRNQRIVDDNIAMMSVRVCVGECVSRSHVVSKEIVHACASPTNHLHTNTHVTLHAMQCGRKKGEFMVGRDIGRNGSTINHADDRQESSALRRATPLPQLVSSGKRMASFCSSSARFFFSWNVEFMRGSSSCITHSVGGTATTSKCQCQSRTVSTSEVRVWTDARQRQ